MVPNPPFDLGSTLNSVCPATSFPKRFSSRNELFTLHWYFKQSSVAWPLSERKFADKVTEIFCLRDNKHSKISQNWIRLSSKKLVCIAKTKNASLWKYVLEKKKDFTDLITCNSACSRNLQKNPYLSRYSSHSAIFKEDLHQWLHETTLCSAVHKYLTRTQ